MRDIRLSIGPAETLLRAPGTEEPSQNIDRANTEDTDSLGDSLSNSVSEEVLHDRELQGYERGRQEALAEYESQIQALKAELEQKNSN